MSPTPTHPLVQSRSPQEQVAWCMGPRGARALTMREFLDDVQRTAACLPERSHVINLCDDRYAFMVGFAAALLRGQTSLLPPSRASAAIADVAAGFPDHHVLTDADVRLAPRHPAAAPVSDAPPPGSIPKIAADRIAAVIFTSGSSGRPKPNVKTWSALVRGAHIDAAALPAAMGTPTLVATVPPQHMYGFEFTVMLALQGHAAAFAGRPFFPEDVYDALRAVPEPRVLVTTPVHLRALAASTGPVPSLSGILCATAPLGPALAARSEARLGGMLTEIFGSTETGCIALRRTVADEPWRLLEDFRLEMRGGAQCVHAPHFPAPVPLNDQVAPLDARHFRLVGRAADRVNIAGKRASLAELNARLLSIEGVRDGVMFLPYDTAPPDGTTLRTAALVVAPTLSRDQVMAALGERIDAAFLPRPLVMVAALPRSDSGKLPRARLLDLLGQASDVGPSGPC